MKLKMVTCSDTGLWKESALDISEKDVNRLAPMSAEEALERFQSRLLTLMEDFTEAAIASLVPEGVSIDAWIDRHNISVIRDGGANSREMSTVVVKDGEKVIEVRFKNGKVLAKVGLARGFD